MSAETPESKQPADSSSVGTTSSKKRIPKTPGEQYEPRIREFMAYFHDIPGKKYPKGHEFSADELAAITAEDICNFLNFKAFGTTNPDANAKVTGSRSCVLAFHKKAISHFLNRNNLSNPTRSHLVKELIERVADLEKGKTPRTPIVVREPAAVAAAAARVGTVSNNNSEALAEMETTGVSVRVANNTNGLDNLMMTDVDINNTTSTVAQQDRQQSQNKRTEDLLQRMHLQNEQVVRRLDEFKMTLENNNALIMTEIANLKRSNDNR
jgi:hypothetical protein